jgi:hypothetical protein
MKIFEIFGKKDTSKDPLTLEKLVEMKLISKEEMLFIKKERALKEWAKETEVKTTPKIRARARPRKD